MPAKRYYQTEDERKADAEYVKWFHTYYRPAMCWSYMVICLFDFLIAPILLGIYSYYTGTYHPWEPLTIKGGGIYHLSMGAVVGVSIWTRGKEKLFHMERPYNDDNDTSNDNDKRD